MPRGNPKVRINTDIDPEEAKILDLKRGELSRWKYVQDLLSKECKSIDGKPKESVGTEVRGTQQADSGFKPVSLKATDRTEDDFP